MGMSDPIAEFTSKMLGIKPNRSEADELSKHLDKSLEDVRKLMLVNGYAKMAGQFTGQEQQPKQSDDLSKTIEAAKVLGGLDQNRQQLHLAELEAERKHRRELEEEIQKMRSSGEGSNMQMMMVLMQMMKESSEKSEKMFQMILEQQGRHSQELLQQEREKQKAQPQQKEKSPWDELAQQALFEKLNYNPPSLADQVEHYANSLKSLGLSVASPAEHSSAEHSYRLKELEMRERLEQRRIDRELELEQRRMENQSKFMQTLQQILPAIGGGLLGGKAGSDAATPGAPAAAQGAYTYQCDTCKQYYTSNVNVPEAECQTPDCEGTLRQVVNGGR